MSYSIPVLLLKSSRTFTRLAQYCHPVTGSILQTRHFHLPGWLNALHDPGQHKRIRNIAASHEDKWHRDLGSWIENNKMLYSPLSPEQGIRPAEIYHGRAKIRYPTKKLLHLACLVQNMNIDEALSKLPYIKNKGAIIIREILLEAQELAVKEHNVEFKSNLHIAQSFTCRHSQIKFPIYRAMGRGATAGYCRFANYYVMLREGAAPPPKPKITALDSALEYVESLRSRTIYDGL